MTREEILSEPAGPRLDSWVAELVMGWRKNPKFDPSPGWLGVDGCWNGWWTQDPPMVEDEYGHTDVDFIWAHVGSRVWNPSKGIEAAWEVVERMREKNFHCQLSDWGCETEWLAQFVIDGGVDFVADAETVCLAICRAALLACFKESAVGDKSPANP